MKKSLNPKEWRIATLEKEYKNVCSILDKGMYLDTVEIEYFNEYKDTLMNLITEECLLLGEDHE